jgi:hypothetical protein
MPDKDFYFTDIGFHGDGIGDAPFRFSFLWHQQPFGLNSKIEFQQLLNSTSGS